MTGLGEHGTRAPWLPDRELESLFLRSCRISHASCAIQPAERADLSQFWKNSFATPSAIFWLYIWWRSFSSRLLHFAAAFISA